MQAKVAKSDRPWRAARLFPVSAGAWLATLGLAAGVAPAATVMVNNGDEPPAATNLIDDASQANDQFYVRNLGCPPAWPSGSPGAACAVPGDRTVLELAAGGQAGFLRAYDASELIVSGGSAISVIGNGAASVEIKGGSAGSYTGNGSSSLLFSGGTLHDTLLCNGSSSALLRSDPILEGALRALGDSWVDVTGGSHAGPFEAYNDATINVYGANFQLDAVPQPYGLISATSGQLTGTLASGAPLDVAIAHNGYDVLLTGRIVLRPAPIYVPGLALPAVFACGALLAWTGARATRRRPAPIGVATITP